MASLKLAKRTFLYFIAVIITIYILFPFTWTLLSSFKMEKDLAVNSLEIIPKSGFTIFNYKFILLPTSEEEWKEAGPYFGLAQFANAISRHIPKAILNSIVVGTLVVVLNLVLASMAGYAFSRLRFPLKTPAFLVILGVRMIPGLAIIIPIYILFKQVGLIDTYPAMVFPYLLYTLPFNIWIMSGFFSSIPIELEEAGQIDGCSKTQTLIKIVLPLSLPGLAAVAVFSFMSSWGEFFFAMILTRTLNAKTLPVLLADTGVIGQYWVYGPINATAVIAIIPSVILCLLTQKLLVKGLTKGAVKG